jgi:hypothetical protein
MHPGIGMIILVNDGSEKITSWAALLCASALASSPLMLVSKKALRLFSALELPPNQNLNFFIQKLMMFELLICVK